MSIAPIIALSAAKYLHCTLTSSKPLCCTSNDLAVQAFVGRHVTVPMSGGRTIPVIADDYVDMEFGTGALKITPGKHPAHTALCLYCL